MELFHSVWRNMWRFRVNPLSTKVMGKRWRATKGLTVKPHKCDRRMVSTISSMEAPSAGKIGKIKAPASSAVMGQQEGFMDTCFLPAAQYLRMSTDHQQYSLGNQADAVARYALQHGFHIVKTYSDPAKSGLLLKNRAGLKQLLKDVIEETCMLHAVLVYDVSRWGRFQDADEAAHYEYLCKSAGVPVHYCAEMFTNDNKT